MLFGVVNVQHPAVQTISAWYCLLTVPIYYKSNKILSSSATLPLVTLLN